MQYFFDIKDTEGMINCFNKVIDNKRKIVFLCIGSTKVNGDAFGPIVGELLKHKDVYGNLKNNVNGNNIEEYKNIITKKYINPYIIAIDSALGYKNIINKIVIGKGGIIPGKALNKNNRMIGDVYINAVVNSIEKDNYKQLINANINNIYRMAIVVANILNCNIKNI